MTPWDITLLTGYVVVLFAICILSAYFTKWDFMDIAMLALVWPALTFFAVIFSPLFMLAKFMEWVRSLRRPPVDPMTTDNWEQMRGKR
jgi:uncharacterized membrane protein